MIDRKLIEFIKEHHVLTLATSDRGEGVHCCNLFYAYDTEANRFIFTSSADTQHVRQWSTAPEVAASVVLETSVVGQVRGLQIEGHIERPDLQERDRARQIYLKRFPFAVVMALELWYLVPRRIKYTDNRLGFGRKILWHADNEDKKN